MLMTGRTKDKVISEMFGDNKKTVLHMKKELYWEELIGEADVYWYMMMLSTSHHLCNGCKRSDRNTYHGPSMRCGQRLEK